MEKIGENVVDDFVRSLASAMYAPYAKATPIYRYGDSYSLRSNCDSGVPQ